MPSVPHILELPLKRNLRSTKTRCTIEAVVVVIILGFAALVAVYTFFFRDRVYIKDLNAEDLLKTDERYNMYEYTCPCTATISWTLSTESQYSVGGYPVITFVDHSFKKACDAVAVLLDITLTKEELQLCYSAAELVKYHFVYGKLTTADVVSPEQFRVAVRNEIEETLMATYSAMISSIYSISDFDSYWANQESMGAPADKVFNTMMFRWGQSGGFISLFSAYFESQISTNYSAYIDACKPEFCKKLATESVIQSLIYCYGIVGGNLTIILTVGAFLLELRENWLERRHPREDIPVDEVTKLRRKSGVPPSTGSPAIPMDDLSGEKTDSTDPTTTNTAASKVDATNTGGKSSIPPSKTGQSAPPTNSNNVDDNSLKASQPAPKETKQAPIFQQPDSGKGTPPAQDSGKSPSPAPAPTVAPTPAARPVSSPPGGILKPVASSTASPTGSSQGSGSSSASGSQNGSDTASNY